MSNMLIMLIILTSYESAGEAAFVGGMTGLFTTVVLGIIEFVRKRRNKEE